MRGDHARLMIPFFPTTSSRGALRAGLLCVLASVLAGCASVPSTHLARAPVTLPLKVVAVEAPLAVEAGRMQEVVAPGIARTLTYADPELAQAEQDARARAAGAMAAALRGARNVVLVAAAPGPSAPGPGVPIAGLDFDSAITPEEAARLRAATGADAVLRYRITDYGLTPRSWRNGYIAFEVTTTLALAAVIAYSGSKAAQAAAGLYLVQETAEETASAYAGFQLFDEVCRPVRVEAKLVALNPPQVLWQTRATGLSDIRLGRYFRKVGAEERNRQLQTATAAAAADVASDLNAALEWAKLERALGLR